MERDEAGRRSVGRWWYTGAAAAVTGLALALLLSGRSALLVVNVAVGVLMCLSFGYVTRKGPPSARRSTPSRLSRLDDRLMARFSRARQRPLNRAERWLQKLDDTYAPGAYGHDQAD